MSASFTTVDWQDGQVVLLDQRKLPEEEIYLRCSHVDSLVEAIRNMTVRGAPAIGVAAGFGVALAAKTSRAKNYSDFAGDIENAAKLLFTSRPTAVNIRWALEQLQGFIGSNKNLPLDELRSGIIGKAIKIKEDDIAANRRLGQFGHIFLEDGDTILTHCNAGALCSAGYGTALGVIYAAKEAGKNITVFADETRPLLQGARLTAWELGKNDIPVTVIADNMAGYFMFKGLIKKVIVGADRIAANGDTANKIGTYALAILAKHHGIPFYIAAPFSSVDLKMPTGEKIPIEERAGEEMRRFNGKKIVADAAKILNPAFDVTPNELISAIITDQGIAKPQFTKSLSQLWQSLPVKN